MSSRVFITLNQDVMTELVRKAERRVFYAAPGIYDWVAEALSGSINWCFGVSRAGKHLSNC
jgi:hypothetical protein